MDRVGEVFDRRVEQLRDKDQPRTERDRDPLQSTRTKKHAGPYHTQKKPYMNSEIPFRPEDRTNPASSIEKTLQAPISSG